MAVLLIVIPLVSLLILNILPRKASGKIATWLTGLVLLTQLTLICVFRNHLGDASGNLLKTYVDFDFAVDKLSFIMLLSIAIASLASFFTAMGMGTAKTQLTSFCNLLLVSVIGMDAMVMVKDLFTLFVFLEVTAITSFILIVLDKKQHALEGAFKYLILSAISTMLMVTGLSLLILVSGSTGFAAIQAALIPAASSLYVKIAIALFIAGAFIKSGSVPFHAWLPDVYSSAPAGVSVLLAGIVTKASGVYLLMRLFLSVISLTQPIQNVIMLVGVISILVGAFAALGQNNFKRMLGYSSISQIGYIILGFGCATPLAVGGAVFHLFNHSIFKSLLFVNAAAVEKQADTVELDQLGGVSQKMPVTGVSSVIALLSTAGVPPLAGFWSKLMIVVGLWLAGYYVLAAIALLASVVTLGYFLHLQRSAFFGEVKSGLENIKEANLMLLIPTVTLSSILVIAGLAFPIIVNIFMVQK